MVELLPPYFSRQCTGQREKGRWFLPPFLPLHLLLIPLISLSVSIFAGPTCFLLPSEQTGLQMSLSVVWSVCHALVQRKDVLKKKEKKRKTDCHPFFVNINSHERMIPDDLGDPELPELKQEMTRWAKLYLVTSCVPEKMTSFRFRRSMSRTGKTKKTNKQQTNVDIFFIRDRAVRTAELGQSRGMLKNSFVAFIKH